VNGASTEEVAKVAGITGKYVSQSVYNRVHDKGTQAAIAELITESNVIQSLTTDKILFHIQKLALDESLKPKEREGYLRMLAEYKALLKQVNLNENVTSSDTLINEAEQALATLKASTNNQCYDKLSDTNAASVASESEAAVESVQGETKPTPSGKE